jgi:hypothetical protein
MTITFADGTRIEVAASAFDDFVRHDLKWVEFVHGRASTKPQSGGSLCRGQHQVPAVSPKQNVHRCPAHGC